MTSPRLRFQTSIPPLPSTRRFVLDRWPEWVKGHGIDTKTPLDQHDSYNFLLSLENNYMQMLRTIEPRWDHRVMEAKIERWLIEAGEIERSGP